MYLRPHHLLCIQKFVGHGYDARFTAHMEAVCGTLRVEDADVTLVCGCDELCTACPNNEGGICTSAAKVARLDGGVMEALNLREGETGKWSALSAKARALLADGRRFEAICADCEWYSLCSGREERT